MFECCKHSSSLPALWLLAIVHEGDEFAVYRVILLLRLPCAELQEWDIFWLLKEGLGFTIVIDLEDSTVIHQICLFRVELADVAEGFTLVRRMSRCMIRDCHM